MPSFPTLWPPALPKLTPLAIVDILLVAVLLYQALRLVRGRRAMHILMGIGILAGAYFAAQAAGLELLASVLGYLAPYTPFALIVMFQSEIRLLLARLGRRRWLGIGGTIQRRGTSDDILLALEQLAEDHVGALIVLERDIGLRTFIESGVQLDAALSRDLLLAIFRPGGALHDGAVIIQGDRIAAAACFLPLTTSANFARRKFGTRHRAAIGVTEETDCLCLVVSEERGTLSIAQAGDIEEDVTIARAEERIARHFGRTGPRSTRARQAPATFAEDSQPESEQKMRRGAP